MALLFLFRETIPEEEIDEGDEAEATIMPDGVVDLLYPMRQAMVEGYNVA